MNVLNEKEMPENEIEQEIDQEIEPEFEQTEESCEKIDSKDKELQEAKDSLQRLQADFNNYRRRVDKEKSDISLFANEKIITELLPVMDNMQRAIDSSADDEKESGIYKGVELVLKQLVDTLKKFGVEEIQTDECDFDPNYHYAVLQDEIEGVEPNKVVDVLQRGYKFTNKVIRPAMVKVSK